jgi:alkylated DNA nucleotide flippase Atl1
MPRLPPDIRIVFPSRLLAGIARTLLSFRMAERDKDEVLRRVRAVPEGYVATYGDVAPGSARWAGAILAHHHDADIPWHRIVRADGSLAMGDRQRELLEAEGVPFRSKRVDLAVARYPAEELGA